MILPFFKYHGAGNDFIILDGRFRNYPELIPDFNTTVEKLCNRHTGIGADGLMILQLDPKHDFQMLYYNSDGYEGSMCGNGGRCLVAFAHHLGITGKKTAFLASDGLHHAEIVSQNNSRLIIALGMTDVNLIEQKGEDYFLNTGSPHLVKFTADLDNTDVYALGKQIRHSPEHGQGGANVNFAQIKGNEIFVRTYERGVENETLACGTGITATAIAAHHSGKLTTDGPYTLHALGGQLQVSFTLNKDEYTNVVLQGPAMQVFKGEIIL